MKTNTMTLHIGYHMINYAFKMLFTDRDMEVWKLSPRLRHEAKSKREEILERYLSHVKGK